MNYAVAALVLKYGGDPSLAKVAVERPAMRFPSKMSLEEWRADRGRALAEMGEQDDRALLVSVCEALHAITDLLHDLKYEGVSTWAKYPVPNMEVFWYFREVLRLAVKRSGLPAGLVGEMGARVKELSPIVFG